MFYQVSGEAVVWTIVGGAGTLFGPLVGTALFIVIREIVSSHWEHHSLLVGLLAILAVIFAPKGIVGLWNGWVTRLDERHAAALASPRLMLQADP
jgi:branched-chain amino acid transport system permease protein